LSGASLKELQPARVDASGGGFGGSVHVVLMQRKATIGFILREERRSDGEEGRKIGNGGRRKTRKIKEKQDNKGNMGDVNGRSYGHRAVKSN